MIISLKQVIKQKGGGRSFSLANLTQPRFPHRVLCPLTPPHTPNPKTFETLNLMRGKELDDGDGQWLTTGHRG